MTHLWQKPSCSQIVARGHFWPLPWSRGQAIICTAVRWTHKPRLFPDIVAFRLVRSDLEACGLTVTDGPRIPGLYAPLHLPTGHLPARSLQGR